MTKSATLGEPLDFAIFDVFPSHIAVLDGGGSIIAVNASWCHFSKLNGGQEDGYLGMNFLEICLKAGAQDVYTAVKSVLSAKRPYFSRDYPCPSLSVSRWFNLRVTPLTGGRDGAVVVYTDITERRSLQEKLQKTEEQFFRIFHHSPAPSLLISLKHLEVIDVNESFLTMVGSPREAVKGKISCDLGFLPLVSRSTWSQLPLWDKAVEHQLRTKAGAWCSVTVSLEPVDIKGQPAAIMTLCDHSDHNKTKKQLVQAVEEVMKDASWLSQAILEKLVTLDTEHTADPAEEPKPLSLTNREHQVLGLMATGMDNEEIAVRLGLASQTVRNYVSRLYSKLDVHTRVEAVVWARQRGFIEG